MKNQSALLTAGSLFLFGAAAFGAPSASSPEEAVEKGKTAYQMNCMACHMVETKLVGPSLVGIAETYPEEKRAEFLAWAKEPGKKDPRLMQMPPMGHVPEETLANIHAYILDVSVGKKEVRGNSRFQSYKEPERELPYVVRGFMPHSSPASLGIVLKENISVCWDTEACRLRYIWPGDRTILKKGHTVADLRAEPFYRETADRLWSLAGDEKPDFLGYRLKPDGSPELAYRIGEIEVREHINNGAQGGMIVRHFTLSDEVGELKLNLEQDTKAIVVSDKGELKSGTLTLTGADTKSFTLTISKP
ncbi:MAG: cytochrome c [Verrucomicrobiales bacterium]|nr:cytochrome c [Verrucomicrobiales bacterium]